MSVPVSDYKPPALPPLPHKRRRWIWLVLGVVVAVIAGFALIIGLAFRDEGRPLPSFPSLTAHPDASLHGTVAYYASDSGCLRLVAASGQSSKTLWCLPKEDSSVWPTVGKPTGPQLVWRPDGRLEVTMFRMQPGPGKGLALTAGWQKIIDVRTGKVESVSAAHVPSTPNTSTEPTVSPSGQRVSFTLDGNSGRAKVTLTDSRGPRELLTVHGPGMYGYRFGPVFWAPNWQWIAASDNDSRILVITTGTPSVTRVLVTGSGGGTAGPTFAVTAADLLATGS